MQVDLTKNHRSRRGLALAGACVLSLMIGACGGDDGAQTVADAGSSDAAESDPRIDAVRALAGDAASGEQLYLAECITCHLADGTGRTNEGAGKDLTDWLPRNPDAAAIDAILSGRQGMLAYDGVYSDQDVADLIAYLRATFDP